MAQPHECLLTQDRRLKDTYDTTSLTKSHLATSQNRERSYGMGVRIRKLFGGSLFNSWATKYHKNTTSFLSDCYQQSKVCL